MPITTRQDLPRVYVWPSDGSNAQIDVSLDVVAFSYQKSKQARGGATPAGSFSLTLMPREHIGSGITHVERIGEYYRRFQPQSAVSLGIQRDGGITLGLVDSVTESFTLTGNRVSRSITLSGTDIAKILTRDQICRAALNSEGAIAFQNAIEKELGAANSIAKNFVGLEGPPEKGGNGTARTFLLQDVDDVIRYIIGSLPSMKIPSLSAVFGPEAPMEEVIRTDKCITTFSRARVSSDSPRTFQGTYFNFVSSILDEDLYEIWVDTIPMGSRTYPGGFGMKAPQPVLIVRPCPFDEDIKYARVEEDPGITWESLTTMVEKETAHIIGLKDVINASFTMTDAEALSYYLAFNNFELLGASGGTQVGMLFPLVDTWTLKRYGLQKYEAHLTLVGDGENQITNDEEWHPDSVTGVLAPSIIEARNRLFNWYRGNPFYELATLTVYGRDDFRIGDPVVLPWRTPPFGVPANDQDYMRYYTTGVTHQYSDPGGYVCTLSLSRGHTRGMMAALQERIRQESSNLAPDGFVSSNPFTDKVTI